METMIVLFTFALLLLIVPVITGYRKHQRDAQGRPDG